MGPTRSGARALTALLCAAMLFAYAPAPAAAVVGYDSQVASMSDATLSVVRGSTYNFQVFVANTGTTTWTKGSSTQVDLANCCPASPSPNAEWNSDWISDSHYTAHTQTSVAPGSFGTFSFNITVPLGAAAGSYKFPFEVVKADTNEPIHPEGYAMVATIEEAPPLTVNVADDADDGTCDAAHCSLREAINAANANDPDVGTPGFDRIVFAIPATDPPTPTPPVISPTKPLPVITRRVDIDGRTQAPTGQVVLDGVAVLNPDGDFTAYPGLSQNLAGGSTFRGLVLQRFKGAGIQISNGDGNIIAGNNIGTDYTGMVARPNGLGILFVNSDANTVGGASTALRNVISGNTGLGIWINDSNSTNNIVEGNYIGVNATGAGALGNGSGIDIRSSSNVVKNNVISGSTSASGVGITLFGSGAANNSIVGNRIGTNAVGDADLGNAGSGISVQSAGGGNLIGGAATGAGNVISGNGTDGNDHNGITLTGTGTGATIQGNRIGTNAAGTTAIPNVGRGVKIDPGAVGIVVGGTTAGAGNVISGNGGDGVAVGTNDNVIQGNYIGTDAAGTGAIGNSGAGVLFFIPLSPASNNTVGGTAAGAGNVIANNSFGVYAFGGTGNSILGNSIFNNGQLGIDLAPQGVTANDYGALPTDPGDADTGANDLQNYPTIEEATTSGVATQITWNLWTTATTSVRTEFFASPTCDPSGHGEGEVFLGQATFTTAANGVVSTTTTFEVGVPVGHVVTATSTGSSGTSEFSQCAVVAAAEAKSVAYIYTGHEGSGEPIDIAGLDAFKALLEGRGYQFDQVPLAVAADHDFTGYDAVIVGHDTGDLSTWGTTAAVQNIVGAGVPVIGVGEGGYAFFGRVFGGKTGTIGWGNGWHTSGTGVVVVDGNDAIWDAPNAITPAPTTGSTLSLYSASSPMVSIHDPSPTSTLVRIGREVGDDTHYPLIAQNGCYLLWGFDASPATMTEAGKDLFENALSQSCTFGADETVTFAPDVVPPGGTVTVTVTGLSEGTSAAITLVDRSGETLVATLGSVALTNGGGSAALVVPESVPSGNYKIRATAGAASALSVNRLFVPVDYANHLWLNPKSLPSGVAVPQHIWRQGQNAWFVIENVPAEALIEVKLTGPDMADYNINLYADIFAAFAAISQPQDPKVLQSQFAPENFSPENFSPENFSPENFSPENFSPENFSPENFSPENFSPENFSPENFSPENFSPENFSPENFSPENFSPENFSPENFSPENFSPENFSPETETGVTNIASYTGAQRRAFITFSSRVGTSTERIVKPSWLNAGNYFVRVRGRNGGFSLSDTFKITVTVTPGACAASVQPLSLTVPVTPAPSETPKYKTLIVSDLSRLEGTPTEKDALMARISTFAARPEVVGKFVDLGELVDELPKYGRVAAARAQAEANKGCPFGMSILAEEMDRVVESYQAIHPLSYVVLIGNDGVIPFFRYPDRSELSLATERNYVPPVLEPTSLLCEATACLSQASLKLNYVLGQDDYGTRAELWRGRYGVPVPDLAVGRLVETAGDATGMLDAYLKTNAGVLSLTTPALVTGYDFLSDGAIDVQFELETGMGTTTAKKAADTLIQPVGDTPDDPSAWNSDQLRAVLLGSRHDIIYLAGHFSAVGAQAADYKSRLASSEVLASTVDLENAIVFSAGCHSGYNIVNLDAIPEVTAEPDWAQTFNRKRATFIGGTGYQYGDTDAVLYGEWLYREFSRQLRMGSGAISVGNALVAAKHAYLGPGGILLRGIDEKTAAQATLFGLPHLSVNMPGPRLAMDEGTITTDVLSGSRINATITPTLNEHTLDLDIVGTTTPITTTYLSGMGTAELVVAAPGQPILPLELRTAPVNGDALLRGVGLDRATYDDKPVVPATSSPATELSNLRSSFESDIFVPTRPWRTNYIDSLVGGPVRIAAIPAQVISDRTTADPLDATLRTYGPMTFRLCYSNTTPTLATGSLISTVSGTTVPGSVNFSIQLNAAASEVWVTYTGTSGSFFYQQWASLDLTNAGGNLWTGTLPLDTQAAADVRYIVQAFSPECLFSLDTNLGRYYTPDVTVGPPARPTPTKITFTAPTGGVYGTTVNVLVDLDSGGGVALPDQPVTVTLGSQTRRARTGSNGQVNVTLGLNEPQGTYTLRASFAGNDTLLPDSASAALTVGLQPTSLTLAPTSTGEYRFVATLTNTMSPARSIDEATVIFVVRAVTSDTPVVDAAAAITNRSGQAELGFTDVTLPAGSYTVSAYFLGTIDLGGGRTISLTSDTHVPSSAAPLSFTVGAESTTVAYTGQLVTADSSALQLSAQVTQTGSPEFDVTQAKVRYVLKSGTSVIVEVTAPYGTGNWAATVGSDALSLGTYTLEVTEFRTVGGFFSSPTVAYLVAVYDPSAGFVTGAGWIDSPAGAYTLDMDLIGRANFGFVSKYQKGATTPTGKTEFQFRAAGLVFKSTSYEWLLVSGAKAQFKGKGRLNGEDGYSFLLTATDGQVSGGGGVDKFRIKIKDSSGKVVYDNKMSEFDDLEPQAIAGGSIVIHK